MLSGNRGNSLIGRLHQSYLEGGETRLRLRPSLVKTEDGEMQGHFGVVDKVPVLSRLAPASKRVLVLSGSLRITEQPCVTWEHHSYWGESSMSGAAFTPAPRISGLDQNVWRWDPGTGIFRFQSNHGAAKAEKLWSGSWCDGDD